MRRERTVGSSANLEFARREVARRGQQMLGGIPLTVTLFAVALHTVLQVERLARLTLCIGPDVGTLRFDYAQRKRGQLGFPRRRIQRGQQESDNRESDRAPNGRHWCTSRARGLSLVK